MSEVVVIARLTPRKGRADELIGLFGTITPEFHSNEPGTLVYSVNRSLEEDGPIIVIEKYKSPEAFALHQENLGKYLSELAALLEGELDVLELTQMAFGDADKRL